MERFTDLETWLRRVGVGASFRALADLLPGAAVVVTDGEGRVRFWSAEAERLFGYEAALCVGEHCPEGVIADSGLPRSFGAAVAVRRADGTSVLVRHYSRTFAEDSVVSGVIHLLVLDAVGAAGVAGFVASDVLNFHGLLTRDPGMARVIQVIRNVAETEATVLVRGESGTGKELVARAIHLESSRRAGPFVAVSCASFSPALLESELFGHVKGAFTGAHAARRGIFAQADGGTLFLDEVAELPLDLQAKLLRVIQERTFTEVGGTENHAVDVRLVAATHRALREEVRAGRFREDLMFRLRVVPIFLPALRLRPLDIDLLLRAFVGEFNRQGPRTVAGFSPDAMRALLDHAWPGNVRELRNVVEYAFAVGRGPTITLDELPPEFREVRNGIIRSSSARSPGIAEHDEHGRVAEALARSEGNVERAAASLGLSRTTFWRLRKRLGV